jgi:hypothetical protein
MARTETPGAAAARLARDVSSRTAPSTPDAGAYMVDRALTIGPGVIVRDNVSGQFGRVINAYRLRPGEILNETA